MKEYINTDNAPAAIGPYSQAVLVGGFLYISGQLPLDPITGKFTVDEISGQTRQSLKNIEAILVAAEYSLRDIVKVTIFIKDMADFNTVNEVYSEFFTKEYPSRAVVAVKDLPKAALIEIDAIAYKYV